MIIVHSSFLDGFLIEVDLDESKIPKFVPVLKKGDLGVCRPRVLVKANGCTPLYIFVKNFLKGNFALIIQSCKCHSPIWICAMDCFFRKVAHGKSHRDTACVSVGNLLVFFFLQTSESGGINFWKQLQNLHKGNQFGVGNRPKNLAWSLQSFEAITMKPEKNRAIIFDSRLIH
jgi:hypothetical protein